MCALLEDGCLGESITEVIGMATTLDFFWFILIWKQGQNVWKSSIVFQVFTIMG